MTGRASSTGGEGWLAASPPLHAECHVVAQVIPARASGRWSQSMMPVTFRPSVRMFPAVHVAVDAAAAPRTAPGRSSPPRLHSGRQLGERFSGRRSRSVCHDAVSVPGPHLPGLDAERAIGQRRMHPGDRRAYVLQEARIQLRVAVIALGSIGARRTERHRRRSRTPSVVRQHRDRDRNTPLEQIGQDARLVGEPPHRIGRAERGDLLQDVPVPRSVATSQTLAGASSVMTGEPKTPDHAAELNAAVVTYPNLPAKPGQALR